MTDIAALERIEENAAYQNLRQNQRQLDMDGCEVGVSRQALEEVLDAFAATLSPPAPPPAPAPAEIEGLVTAADDLLRASISDYGLDDTDPDDESVAAGLGAEPHGRPWQSAVKFGHMRRLQDAIARLTPPAETRPVVPEAGLTRAAEDVLAERRRQIEVKGWAFERDDNYARHELVQAATCYADRAVWGLSSQNDEPPLTWPWHRNWWKPTVPRRMLIKAGALILAEIERRDRAARAAERGEA